MTLPWPTGCVLALGLCLAISSARAETLTLIPPTPIETSSTVLRFQGVSTSFPAGVVLYRSTRSGALLVVEGCYPTPSFPGIVNYTLDVPVGVLPASTYSVTYSVARCNQQNIPIESFVLLLTTAFVVASDPAAEAIPALSLPLLAALGLVVLVTGLGYLRVWRSRG